MDVLRRGFSTDVHTGVMDVKANIRAEGKEVRLDVYGPFEMNGPTTMPSMELEISASGPFDPVDFTIVTTGHNAFVTYQGAPFEVGRDLWGQLFAFPYDAPKTFSEMGVEPEGWVSDAEVVGTETLSGTKVTEVSGTLDLKQVLNELYDAAKRYPPGEPMLPRGQTDAVLEEVDEIDFRAWVGNDDGVLRRFTTGLDLDEVAFDVDMRVEEPNEPVEIRTPDDAAPISELLQLLGVPPDALLGPGAQMPVPG